MVVDFVGLGYALVVALGGLIGYLKAGNVNLSGRQPHNFRQTEASQICVDSGELPVPSCGAKVVFFVWNSSCLQEVSFLCLLAWLLEVSALSVPIEYHRELDTRSCFVSL